MDILRLVEMKKEDDEWFILFSNIKSIFVWYIMICKQITLISFYHTQYKVFIYIYI
jgi:hypothetical protein